MSNEQGGQIETGGPAFPVPNYVNADGETHTPTLMGMSLRDYFAGQALIGILGARNGFMVDCGTDNASEWAYRIADNMLAARNAEPAQ